MKKKLIQILFLLVCVLFFVLPSSAETNSYIDVTNPGGGNKIPLAAPTFSSGKSSSTEGSIAIEGTDILKKALDFTRLFAIVDPSTYLWNPSTDDVTGAKMNYQNWVTVGAELLVTGEVKVSWRGQMELDMRLFDVFKGQVVLFKQYKGSPSELRNMVHQFCAEIIYYLTGNYGVFGSKIAFISPSRGNVRHIYVADFDGSNPKAVISNGAINLTPAWCSDGKRLAYTSFVEGGADLYVQDLSGKRQKIASYSGVNINPAWVPGKSELAISCSFTGSSEIYLLTAEGKIIKRITNSWGINTSPTFSPDGSQLAFVSDRGGSPQIYVCDINGGNVRRVSFSGRYSTQPAWSPKGDKIAYTTGAGSVIDIYVVDVQTGALMKLTEGSGKNENPAWSPDGSLIAFSSTRSGGIPKIYTMTLFGMDQQILLDMPGTQPAWSPRFLPK